MSETNKIKCRLLEQQMRDHDQAAVINMKVAEHHLEKARNLSRALEQLNRKQSGRRAA